MAHTLTINGKPRSVDVDDDTPLLWVLRDVLGMTGTKFGCGLGLCGACTILTVSTAIAPKPCGKESASP
jgi:isoquinoline 1-oxidoreductase alpha subunit